MNYNPAFLMRQPAALFAIAFVAACAQLQQAAARELARARGASAVHAE